MFLVQRRRQRVAAAHALAHALDQLLRVLALGQVEQDAERAVQWLAGAQQGRQLMGELGQLIAAERAAPEQRRETAAAGSAIGQLGLQRRVALVLQPADHLLHAGSLHLPLQRLAGVGDRLVAELRHVNRPALHAGPLRAW